VPDAEEPDLVFHVALQSDWLAARTERTYRMSTRGSRLEDVGFIHASFEDQLERTGALIYADVTEPLVVLVIDADKLEVPVIVEDLRGEGDAFPHIYGPVPVSAVVDVFPAKITPDGAFVIDRPD
jgi:glutathione S-transferase